ncbi:unnamed protein product [Darwinula stevensoni]|uniref:Transmembrane protein 45B n=1 Tax=Darwinula stevensoni TaxID=69355 RepID=A0A7R8X794_9CRUS|nr:unnamed protein product [Darwinula stevensoni]CAG0887693.1 unnamed protein product [Darwinula stevensoni]
MVRPTETMAPGKAVGELAAGCIWTLAGLWWMGKVLSRFYRKGPDSFRASSFYCIRGKRIPFEPVAKFVIGIIYFFGEYSAGLDEKGEFVNREHATFMAFSLAVVFSGMVDLATFFQLGVPKDFSYVTTFFIPFSGWYIYRANGRVQGHGHMHMDVEQGSEPVFDAITQKETTSLQMGHLITLSYLLLGVTVLLESWERGRTSVVLSLLRPMASIQLGVAYMLSSFLVYNPCCRWEAELHGDRALPLLQSIWCVLFPASATFVIAVYAAVTWARKQYKGEDFPHDRLKSQEEKMALLQSDSSEEPCF